MPKITGPPSERIFVFHFLTRSQYKTKISRRHLVLCKIDAILVENIINICVSR